MRIAIWGNNLNYGYELAAEFTSLGHDAQVILPLPSQYLDLPTWWKPEAEIDSTLIIEVKRPNINNPLPMQFRPSVIKINRLIRNYDCVIVREDGPAVLARKLNCPKIFISQGADIQLRPFILRTFFGRDATRQLLKFAIDSIKYKHGMNRSLLLRRFVWHIFSRMKRFPGAIIEQARQRQGLRNSDLVIIAPYEVDLAKSLDISEEKIQLLTSFASSQASNTKKVLGGIDIPAFVRNKSYVFLHLTRMMFIDLSGDKFLKCNDNLIRAYAKFLGEGSERKSKSLLVLVEKGRPEDLASAKSLILNLGIFDNVLWMSDMKNTDIHEYLALSNVILCDQFSPNVSSLGNLSREAIWAGAPLITAMSSEELNLFSSPPPNLFQALTIGEILNAMVETTSLTQDDRKRMKEQSKTWAMRNIDRKVLGIAYLRLITSVNKI